MSTQPCSQPGCPGTILDGYCDICGSPAGTPAAASSGTDPTAIPGTPAGTATPVGASPSTRSSVTSSSNRLASAPIGSARAKGTRTTRKVGTSSTRLRGSRLGAGLTHVPPVPPIDAEAAIMKDPQVPEDRRFCPSCGKPVGRSREGRPGRSEGFCPNCRTRFDFTPKLTPGTLVSGQYEVAGCLAHGGLGWIYLARDRNVSDRWVVLKGLLNSGDADAYAAAVAEREFLARVKHPLIVEIYNFVRHDGASYIVMEYVGGTSLKTILKDRMRAAGGRYDPIPVDQAIAYIVEILPAFGYLHDLGLVYCDFKPDNMIQVGDAVKLIDLGAVREATDEQSAIFGTVGYQAPEIGDVAPSVASDLYTVGRTLTVLVTEFRGYQSTYVASLPPVAETPVFARHDSLYRLLAKACAPEPADRFQTADELRVQLLGVLREIVAAAGNDLAATHSAPSVLFAPPLVAGGDLDWQDLPALAVDPGDPMTSWLATLSVSDPGERIRALERAPQETVEVLLATARAGLQAGRFDVADAAVARVLGEDPWEWRAVWMQGLAALVRNDAVAARAAFNAVYGQVPGELAPKLALALACERSGEADVAQGLYSTCARTDVNYIAPAAFGLVRIRRAAGDVDGALAALELVPATSRAYVEARRQRAGLLAASDRGLPGLAEAMQSIEAVTIDPSDRAALTANVLDVALRRVLEHGPDRSLQIAGRPATEPHLRDGVEAAYRHLAQLTDDQEEKVRYVDKANAERRWTLR